MTVHRWVPEGLVRQCRAACLSASVVKVTESGAKQDPDLMGHSGDERDRRAAEREDAADDREAAANERDRVADERERLAD